MPEYGLINFTFFSTGFAKGQVNSRSFARVLILLNLKQYNGVSVKKLIELWNELKP